MILHLTTTTILSINDENVFSVLIIYMIKPVYFGEGGFKYPAIRKSNVRH